ncbi:MAG: GrpB family protein [Candidatus Saccharibacteria bacterium]
MSLQLHEYNNQYVNIFIGVSNKLRSILDNQCEIHHIGSTSIPGTDGKGVIDIMLAFNNHKAIKQAINKLQLEGYYLSNNPINTEDRVFMSSSGQTESKEGDVHLHLTTKNSDIHRNAVLFREYLINHPEIKQQYIDLKYKIKDKVGNDRPAYTKAKADFIKSIIAIAKKEVNN